MKKQHEIENSLIIAAACLIFAFSISMSSPSVSNLEYFFVSCVRFRWIKCQQKPRDIISKPWCHGEAFIL
jgi:hypothetical protein